MNDEQALKAKIDARRIPELQETGHTPEEIEKARKLVNFAKDSEERGHTSLYYRLLPQIENARALLAKEGK